MSALATATEPRLPALPADPKAAPQVGRKAARGAFWSIFFSVLTKMVTAVTHIGLAWFITPEQFGLMALTLSFISLSVIFSGAHFRNILIRHPGRFEELAGQVFWFSLFMTLGAAAALASLSPVAGSLYQEPRVIPLILLALLASPIQALSTIYAAKLNRNLRFRRIASIHFSTGLAQNLTALSLAALGFGAYALLAGLLVCAVTLTVFYRWSAGAIPLSRPRPSQWGALFSPVSWLMVFALFQTLILQGVHFVIGVMKGDPTMAGFYYWGFAVASQTIFLLTTNLRNVLFPILSTLNADPERQFRASQKATQTLLAVIAPACLFQILLAGPWIVLVFKDRWVDAVPVVQWLSLGMATQPLSLLATSLLMARARFKTLALFNGAAATIIIASAVTGATLGDQKTIALATGLSMFLCNLGAGWVAYRELNRGLADLAKTILPVLALMLPVIGLGVTLVHFLPQVGLLGTTALVLGACSGLYLLLVQWLQPQLLRDVLLRLKSSKSRPQGGSAS